MEGYVVAFQACCSARPQKSLEYGQLFYQLYCFGEVTANKSVTLDTPYHVDQRIKPGLSQKCEIQGLDTKLGYNVRPGDRF